MFVLEMGYSVQLSFWSLLLVRGGLPPQNHNLLSHELMMLNSRVLLRILHISLISELKQVVVVFSGLFHSIVVALFFFGMQLLFYQLQEYKQNLFIRKAT